ncbi:hypothetical protein BDR04DRAFT_1097756, partial [Suillus decipiens]
MRGRASPAERPRSAETIQPVPMKTIRVHSKKVWAVAFLKDGRQIVTASSQDTILRIWDVEEAEMVGTPFKGLSNCVDSVAVSPDD